MTNEFEIQAVALTPAHRGDESDVEARPCYPFTSLSADE